MNTHAINWFEIPVTDFDRAKKFYQSIYDFEMPETKMDEVRMGFFMHDMENGGRGGAIVHHPNLMKPGKMGTLVYLNGEPDLNTILERVEKNGGKVLHPKSLIADNMGYWALFEDTEGNNVGLHSMQ